MAENLFRTTDEIAAVARLAQGVGRDHAYGTLGHAADELGEAAQAVEAALGGLFAKIALLVEAGGQLDLLAQPFEDADFAVDIGLARQRWKLLEPRSRAAISGNASAGFAACFASPLENCAILPR